MACLVPTDELAAGLAELRIEVLEAAAAAGPAALHDVPLSTQRQVTLQAAEVLHVPAPALGLRAFLSEDQLGREGTRQTSARHKRWKWSPHAGSIWIWVATPLPVDWRGSGVG